MELTEEELTKKIIAAHFDVSNELGCAAAQRAFFQSGSV